MGAFQWAQLLFSVLSALPKEVDIVQSAVNDHWGKDHVAQAQHGLKVLGDLVSNAGAAMASGQVSPIPSPEMGVVPEVIPHG